MALRKRYLFHYEMQEGLCFYCRKPLTLPRPFCPRYPNHPDSITIEHLISVPEYRRAKNKINTDAVERGIPRSKHAKPPRRNAPENLVVACLACNNQRGGHIPWRVFLLSKIEELWGPK